MEEVISLTRQCRSIIEKHPNPASIPASERQKTYDAFFKCITYHNQLYYEKNQPIISDYEYDQLFDYFKKLEEVFPNLISPESPTQTTKWLDDKVKGEYFVEKQKDGHSQKQKAEHFPPAFHKVPLLSLENTYDAADIHERYTKLCNILEKKGEKTENLFFSIEPKFDGVSVELVYEGGRLVQASTRGDGYVGDDITQNVCMIQGVNEISYYERLHVRGEILLSKKEFEKLNQERRAKGLPLFANTRNAAAGSIKLLDPLEVKRRNLTVVVYDILLGGPLELQDCGSSTLFKWFRDVGLPHMNVFVQEGCKIDDVVRLCTDTTTKKKISLLAPDFDFDGLVIKLTGQRLRELVGSTNHHPRWAMAFKFPAQQVATQVISVDRQVGRTGVITPVANIAPVSIGGVKIKRVSLHNMDFIQSKDIHIGDRVWIQRSGEVIPHVLGVIEARRKGEISSEIFTKDDENSFLEKEKELTHPTLLPILPPSSCPACQHQVFFDETFYFCTNPNCPAQLKQRLLHFASRQCMDIEGLGKGIVTILIDREIVKKIVDIYKLLDPSVQAIVKRFPGFGEKKVYQLTQSLLRSKRIQCWRFLHALGLPQIGKKNAQNIQKAIEKFAQDIQESKGNSGAKKTQNTPTGNFYLPKKPLELLPFLSDELFLSAIYGIGKETVRASVSFCQEHREVFADLTACGIEICWEKEKNTTDTQRKYAKEGEIGIEGIQEGERKNLLKKNQKSFSVTGTFPIPREKLVELFLQHGYTYDETVKKTTSFLLVGENPGSKLQKAQEYDVILYQGRSDICREFPFLTSTEASDNPTTEKGNFGVQMSLF